MIDFIYSDTGRMISLFIIGLGLSLLFRKVCEGPECVIIKGPPVAEIKDKIFRFDEKCYSYQTVMTSCQKKDNSNSIASNSKKD